MSQLTPTAMVRDLPDTGRTLYIGDEIPDDAPQLVREGIARRHILFTTGTCPCGATFTPPSRQQRRWAQRHGEIIHVAIVHEHDCAAGDDILRPAVNEWMRTAS